MIALREANTFADFVSIYNERDRKDLCCRYISQCLEIISFVVLRHVNLIVFYDGHDFV